MAATATQSTSIARWIPSLPAMLMNPFGGETNNDSDKKDADSVPITAKSNGIAHDHNSAQSRPPMQSAFSFADSDASPSPSRTSRSSFFAEPETTNSMSAGSREGSIDGKRVGKSRPKTQFSVCHPPPESRTRQRLHRRPRSLLQLHRLRESARPMPAFEVVPSANFSLSLNAAVTRIFKTKHGLCPKDVVVMKAEKYSTPSDEEDEDKEARDVIGLICKGRKEEDKVGNKAKIVMADGKTWDAYSINNGGYEFYSADKNGLGLTVRWVPKRNKEGIVLSKDGTKRFNFSTISPSSRRHPVIASLSKTAMDINDSYRIPEPTPATPLGTPKVSNTILEDAMDEEIDRQTCQTDPHLRELITMTSIFVTFKEGWSPSFKYDDKDKDQVSKFGPHSPTKSVGSPIVSPPGSPALSPRFHPELEKRGSIRSIGSGIIRRTSLLSKSNRNSIASMSEDEHNTSPSRSNSVVKTGRARADSSSTVLVHRAASNRRKNNQQWRPELLGAQRTLQENSKEDLGRMSASKNRSLKSPSPLAGVETNGNPTANDSRHSSLEKKEEEQHRQSITTMGSANGTRPKKQSKKGKKSSRLRRLFCVSADSS